MIIFTDNFNRADSTALGANWNELAANPAGGWQVLTNQLRGPSTNQPSTAHVLVTTTTAHAAIADVFAYITRVAGTSFDGGPAIRMSAGVDTSYYVDFTGTNAWQVYRRVAGVDTAVGSPITSASANGDVMGISAQGTTLKVFKNGAQIGSNLSDSGISAAGQTGVVLWSGSADLDNFNADNLITISIEQEGFQWRNDDGSESTATSAAAQDTNISAPINVIRRLREIVNTTGDAPAKQLQLEYRKVGDSTWNKL